MKNKIIIIVLIVLTIIGIILGVKFKKVKEDDSLDKIIERKTFILGLDDSFPPMGYRNEENEIVGFDIDVAKEVSKRLGVELKLQPISWVAKEQELNTSKIDCIWNGMSKNEEREEAMCLSDSYMKNRMVFVVKNSDNYNDINELKNKNVGVQSGSSAEEILETAEIGKELTEIIPYEDNITAFMDLETNRVDAIFTDEVLANYFIASNNKNYKILNESLEDEEYVIGFRKQDVALCNKINEILKEMKQDGTLGAISERWFGKDVTIIK